MKKIIILVLVSLTFVACIKQKKETLKKLPNIVFILADDMGYGDAGCYNSESRIPTPNIDKLASEGILFTDAHSPAAVCTPSRYGILTGRYCWRTRMKEGVLGGYSPALIDSSRLTLASMLKEQGYATACIGKWHIGANFHDKDGNPVSQEKKVDFTKPISGGPNALGFDYAWFNAGCGMVAPPYGFIENDHFVDKEFYFFDHKKSSNGSNNGMMGKSWQSKEGDVIIAQKACAYIKTRSQNPNNPFFLYLTPNAPHEPCREVLVPEFARGKSSAGARGDLVWLFDWIVGEVSRTLQETGQADNTLLIVTSDNGALPGTFIFDAKGNRLWKGNRNYLFDRYDHKSCGNWRGYKAHIWEGGHRIPMIATWPGKIEAGAISDEVVCLTDIMATCAALTGYHLLDDAAEDSFCILPVLLGDRSRGNKAGKSIREAIVHHSSFGVFSIRQGHWKLILDTKSSGGWLPPRGKHPQSGTPGQLYDISKDPAEAHDLWENEPDIVARLSELLESYKRSGRSTPEHEAQAKQKLTQWFGENE